MKQYNKYISLMLLVLLGAGCTNEQGPTSEPVSSGTLLNVSAGTRADDDYEAFAKGKQIRVYYAHSNLNTTYEFLQGVYQFNDDSKDKTKAWTPIEWTPEGGEKTKGIYLENIKKANGDGGKYIFTATSYPEPHIQNNNIYNLYQVESNQTAESDHSKSDFVASRAVCDTKPGTGLTFHFRHVLSQLVVKLILPKGKTEDGFFPDPKGVKIDATLIDKYNQYTVAYINTVKTGEIFETSTTRTKTGIKMYKDPNVADVKTPTGNDAACHTFSAILPKQTVTDKLLTFNIGGKVYSYTTPDANTVLLDQEKITIIQLTVLSGPGNQKLQLNSVTMEDWKTDKADVGDLIPEKFLK